MSEPECCSNCGRQVRLKAWGPKGRVCSNCSQILGMKPCGTCGEVRRVAGTCGAGRPRCERCKKYEARAASDGRCRTDILAAVVRADPALAAEVAEAALDAAAETTRSLRRLAGIVRESPDVFTEGPTSHPEVLDRFTKALVAAGAQISPIYPECRECKRARPLNGSGLCSACDARARREPCGECGRVRAINSRNADGTARCYLCVRRRERSARLGELAGAIAAIVRRADRRVTKATVDAVVDRIAPTMPAREQLLAELEEGDDLGQQAHRSVLIARLLALLRDAGSSLPPASCAICGGEAEPLFWTKGIVRCQACVAPTKKLRRTAWVSVDGQTRKVTRDRGTCGECGRTEVILDDERRCRSCRDRAARRCEACGASGPRSEHAGGYFCIRCRLTMELGELFGGVADEEFPELRTALRTANPTSARHWLVASKGGQLLTDALRSRSKFSHEMLDEHAGNSSVDHLRHLLVAAGVLPPEDRSIEQFAQWSSGFLDVAAIDAVDRRVAQSWLRWSVLARLRRRQERDQPMTHSVANARNQLRGVVRFLGFVTIENGALDRLTQETIDRWFGRDSAAQQHARPFLVWAQRRRHLPSALSLPPASRHGRWETADEEARWTVARRLVTDDGLAADVRVAAALVVLYGQPVSRVIRLTRQCVHRGDDGRVVVELDGHPLPVQEPFGRLIGELPLRRRGGISDQFETEWLFPATKPGRHVNANTLSSRLRRIGIEPQKMRNAARAQLAVEIPPAMLSEIIGIDAATAVEWAARAAGNWTSYAAEKRHGLAANQH